MPATSSFKIPVSKTQTLTTSKNKSKIGEISQLNVTSSPQCHIIHVERHRYSMIKYTKMVTSVTFK